MSHFNAYVFVPRNDASSEQMIERANDMLSRFDINKETEPYKHYIEANELQRIASRYGIDVSNYQAIAANLREWNGNVGGVDKQGVYELSTQNPDGHIDSWSIITEVKSGDLERFLLGQGSEGKTVKAIITPDGKWIDGPWVHKNPNMEQEKELDKWNKQIATILEKYPDAVVFLVNCHI